MSAHLRERTESPYEKKVKENAIAEAAQTKAVQDYNIMMGNLEDPSEDEEEGEING